MKNLTSFTIWSGGTKSQSYLARLVAEPVGLSISFHCLPVSIAFRFPRFPRFPRHAAGLPGVSSGSSWTPTVLTKSKCSYAPKQGDRPTSVARGTLPNRGTDRPLEERAKILNPTAHSLICFFFHGVSRSPRWNIIFISSVFFNRHPEFRVVAFVFLYHAKKGLTNAFCRHRECPMLFLWAEWFLWFLGGFAH